MSNKLITLRALLLMLIVSPAAYADATPDGAPLYKSTCVMCHGADGAGQTTTGKSMKVRDLRSDDVQKQSDADLARVIAEGKAKMPAYKARFSADEIQALVSFIRTLKTR